MENSELYQQFLAGTCNSEELDTLFRYFGTANEAELKEMILAELGQDEREPITEAEQQYLQETHGKLTAQLFKERRSIFGLWPRTAAAASVILCLSAGGYFLLHKKPVQQIAQNQIHDIAPGHNQATLILANGSKIILTKGLAGKLARQGSTIINAVNNTITYQANAVGDAVNYNTLTTARGEQSPYPLVLADGTKVWLNAESSITFPTAFNDKERIVKITGEAFFEVAHNSQQPFKVQAAGQTIEDIGTQFDVNAYTDESSTRTTLVEGSVRINSITLKPGQQYDGKQVTAVNTAQALAWKEGKFRFVDDNIKTVMRQLSRWYDIDVSYTGAISSEGFNASISRNQNISVVLNALERTNGVHFKIEGRRVTVIE